MVDKYIKVVEKVEKWDIGDIRNLFTYKEYITGNEYYIKYQVQNKDNVTELVALEILN